jgi:hypothetical protein
MASLQLQSNFDLPRPQSGLLVSPASSPHIPRSSSQASFVGHSPAPDSQYPTAHAQPYRSYQPHDISLPSPHFTGNGYPSTAPPFGFYPTGPTPIYSSRYVPGSHPMMRTVSHAHPMNSADLTASSQYSSSPHTPHGTMLDPPQTAAGAQLGPYMHGPPAFSLDAAPHQVVNPQIFNYPMSRSTSGASEVNEMGRLLTPHYEYRDHLSPNEHEYRKVSDSLDRVQAPTRYLSSSYGAHFNLAAHTQPETSHNGPRWGAPEFAMSSERGETKMEMTEYERERAQQIMSNKKLLDDVGLGHVSQQS